MAAICVQARFEEDKVLSVAFNSDHEDMLAYCDHSMLHVRIGSHKPSRQRCPGPLVAFKGAKVFCLQGSTISEEAVPLSNAVQQYAEHRAWDQAYSTACLGATQEDWAALGQAALAQLELSTARKAYIRVQDLLMLNLVHRLEAESKAGVAPDILRGEISAHWVRTCSDTCSCVACPELSKLLELFTLHLVDRRLAASMQTHWCRMHQTSHTPCFVTAASHVQLVPMQII